MTRSENMARIRSSDTKPEVALRHALWRAGLRYRLNAKTPGGRADLVFHSAQLAVFVDGCFWHGCPDHYVRPRNREEFWARKLRENVARDRRQTLTLEELGWRVFRIWEHDVPDGLAEIVAQVRSALRAGSWSSQSSLRVVRVEPLDPEGSRERRHLEDLRDERRRHVLVQRRQTRKDIRELP